jgi:peptidyl-prolyl cis-trans isomerase A (cyclophilin A)
MKQAIIIVSLLLLAGCGAPTMQEIIILETSKGTIEIELFTEEVPTTTQNFIEYVESGFYDGIVFHRVISDFMIQGGGFTPSGEQKSTQQPIPLEASIPNTRGTIAMARTNNPNSATAQFFINVVDNDFLNPGAQGPGYAVFGRVITGLEVVDEIARVPTTTRYGMPDWPEEDILITRAYKKE